MSETAFCPHCGARRPEWARFCGACGNGYDAPAVGTRPVGTVPPAPLGPTPSPAVSAAVPLPVAENPRQLATLAGVAWIAAALLIGYLAMLQFQYASEVEGLGEVAVWNVASAALSVAAGALVIASPSRSRLMGSAVFGTLGAAYQVWQISEGATNEAFLGATVAYGAAAVLSVVAWSRWQDPGTGARRMILCATCGKPVDDSPTPGCPFCGGPIRATAWPTT